MRQFDMLYVNLNSASVENFQLIAGVVRVTNIFSIVLALKNSEYYIV